MKKITNNLLSTLAALALVMLPGSCNDDDPDTRKRITISPGPNAQNDAQSALIDVGSGTDIYFKEGIYEFTSQLSIDDKSDVRILGAGREETILSFKDQTASGEGLLATHCSKLLFQDLTIRDAKGDALKAKNCEQVSFVNVGTVWSGEPRAGNGAYGLYPVECKTVFIDRCYAYGASDAGIYVGQSNTVIIRNSTAEGNVVGIEVENTISADVYNNSVSNNTGGILVLDLPGLTQYGSKCRVFGNTCDDNNRTNFAPPGNIVGVVPPGTGIMVLSTRDVEIFDNEITDNMFAGTIMASYLLIGTYTDPNYNPLYANIYLHDNSYRREGVFNLAQPEKAESIASFLAAYGFEQPDILIDNLTSGNVCISEADGTTLVNLHAESIDPDTGEGNPDSDLEAFTCNGSGLEAVLFQPYGADL
jgi:parallel beta-helix repeat protein